jgi:GT2 family glycosyltransferase
MDPPSRLPSHAPPRVLVVTVNYRTAALVERSLEALAAERALVPGLACAIVDNASGDGSAAALERAIAARGYGAWARVVVEPRNRGFGAGNNVVLREALAGGDAPELFLLLNPDAVVYPGAVATLRDFLSAHPEAGIVGPATEIGRGALRGTAFRFPGILNAFDEGLQFGPLSRLLGRFRLAPPPRPDAHRTDWVSGGCMLVRREVFLDVGLFDEGYFLYFEEVDLHLRAARRGWQTWYVPAARVLHDAGASTGVTGERALESRVPAYWFESRSRYLRKNRGGLVKLAADLAWLSGSTLRKLRLLFAREPRPDPPGFYRDFVRFNLLPSSRRRRDAA